jgi:hypothetical protein
VDRAKNLEGEQNTTVIARAGIVRFLKEGLEAKGKK